MQLEEGVNVVYFDQQPSDLYGVRWPKSSFSGFSFFFRHMQKKIRKMCKKLGKILKMTEIFKPEDFGPGSFSIHLKR